MEESLQKKEVFKFLQCAARGDIEGISTSLMCNPDLINAQLSESGDTALIVAAQENQPESTDACQDVNTLNAQGLSPLMLVARDVDLFDGLIMEREYRPVSVLEQLIKYHGDTQLLDLNGNSAMSYASLVNSPIKQQLLDILENSPPPSETLDEDFCGFCPATKPTLSDKTALALDIADSQNTNSGNEPGCDEASAKDIIQEPEAAKTEVQPFQEIGGASPPEQEKSNTMDRRKKNFLTAPWLPNFSPKHLTSTPSMKKHSSLPPLQVKKDEDVQLKRLGLGYLFQEAHSDPNTAEAQSAVDPLQNLRYIKEHIRQRLGTGESTGNSKTFPPVCYSPRSPVTYKLRPLAKTSSSNSKTKMINTQMLDKSKEDKIPCGHESVQNPDEGLDMVLSKDQVQFSLVSVTTSESAMGNVSSRSAQSSIRFGSEEREDKEGSMNHHNTKLPQICSKILEQQNIDRLPNSNWNKEIHSLFESEPLAAQTDLETVRETPSNREDKIITNCELLKKELLHCSMTDKNTKEDNVDMPLNDNRLLDVGKVIESIKINSPRTPRTSYVSFVHITFSEQEAKTEDHHPPPKQYLAKRKPNLSILTHVSRSFNINAQKENDRSKKSNQLRNNSTPNLKYPRPLSSSNENCGKCVPLPALVYSSGPSTSKMSKKGDSMPGSAERKSQRSQTQLSLYTKKRLNSPVNPAMPPRAKTAHDFQDIHYSDMFVEIKPQNNGPAIFQMFESPFYSNSSKDGTRGRKVTSSTSSNRSCSSISIRSGSSRESSAKSSKRTKPRNKKNSSATNRQRKDPLIKPVGRDISEKPKDNTVIISGTNWEIKTLKQEGNVSENTLDILQSGISNLPHPDFSDLSIIKEATIENSLTINEASKITFVKRIQEVGKVNHTEKLKKEHVDLITPTEGNGKENIAHQAKTVNNERGEGETVHIFKTGDLGQPPQDFSASERPLEEVQLSQGEGMTTDLIFGGNTEKKILIENGEDCVSIPMNVHSSGTSDMLISFEICMKQIDEQSNDSRTVKNYQDNYQSANVHCEQHADEETNLIQISRCTSPNDWNTNNTIQSEKYFESSNDGSIHWIKGEVLGRGAYGTVYCGLTSQGELIAAKQVMLHGSDPAVAEKEYKKLQEEVDLLKTLKHENIVGYLGTCLQDNIVTIFMEFVPGGSIASILRHFGPLQEAVISKYTNHILQGTAYLHKNRVVHRDIKGNNVMLMPSGVIKLIDFGCAKRLNGLNMNGTHGEMLKSMHGTPYWMAPEVISESGHGEKSDIWSIGCTVFEMATGKPPLAHMNKLAAMFYIAAQKGLMPTLPDHFSRRARDFVNLCLIRDQEERPSAEQLLQHSFTRGKSQTFSCHSVQ
ncbi:mitogen-activated protein kinase kinase kinase 19 isoform X2 [Pyxicephalus adspersus]